MIPLSPLSSDAGSYFRLSGDGGFVPEEAARHLCWNAGFLLAPDDLRSKRAPRIRIGARGITAAEDSRLAARAASKVENRSMTDIYRLHTVFLPGAGEPRSLCFRNGRVQVQYQKCRQAIEWVEILYFRPVQIK
jgi:hypothetical protein